MKVRIRLSLLICLLFVLVLAATTGYALENRIAEGSCGAPGSDVSWILDNEGTLSIYGSGAIANFDSTNPPWYEYRYDINRLEMSDGITVIGKKAFADCINLSSGHPIANTAAMPFLVPTQIDAANATGSIPTDSTHEYSVDGVNWTRCSGPMTGLGAGTYYVRVAATSTVQASPAQIIVISGEAAPTTLVGLTTDKTEYVLGETITFTAVFEGTGSVEAMQYYLFDSSGTQVAGSTDISNTFSFTPTVADSYILRAYVKPVVGEWHSVDSAPVTVTDPQAVPPADDPIQLTEFHTDVEKLNIFEQINFILRYTGSDYTEVKQMLFYTYDGRGNQLGDPWVYDGFIGHYGFISSAAGSYAIRVFMLMDDGSMQIVTSPFFTVIDPDAPPIVPLELSGFTTNTSELKVGDQIDFLLTYTGNDFYTVGRMLFYTYDGNGQQIGDPWVFDGFIGHYGFISSIPGYYAIRVFMLTNDGGEQVVTSPFFMVYAKTNESNGSAEKPADPSNEANNEVVVEESNYIYLPAGEIYADKDCTKVLAQLNKDGVAFVSEVQDDVYTIHFDSDETVDTDEYLTGYVRIADAHFLTVDQASTLDGRIKDYLLITKLNVTLATSEEDEIAPEATEEPVEEPVEPTEEPIEEPVVEPTEESVEEPVVEPTEESAEEPMVEPTEESVEEPVVESVEAPVEEVLVESVEEAPEVPVGDEMNGIAME